jgi:radical SAM superfamily enzyme YgiQ (UPF0313 family)
MKKKLIFISQSAVGDTNERVNPSGLLCYHSLMNYAFKDERISKSLETVYLNFPGMITEKNRVDLPYIFGDVPLKEKYEQCLAAAEKILSYSPDIVAVSMYMWNRLSLISIMKYIRQINDKVTIIVGGPETHGINIARVLLEEVEAIDYIISGEGEIAFQRLLQYLLFNEGKLEDVPFAAFRKNEKIITSGNREIVTNLDEIPSPILSLSDDDLLLLAENNFMTIETSRGCVNKCAYCNFFRGVKGIRCQSFDRVKEEIDLLKKNNIHELELADANFIANRKRAIMILEYIYETFPDCRLYPSMSLDMVSEQLVEILNKMLKSGQIPILEVGLQSSNLEVLNLCNRRMNFNKTERVAGDFETGIHSIIMVDVLLGLPGDTLDTFIESLDYANDKIIKENMGTLGIYLVTILAGSTYREKAEDLGIVYMQEPPYAVLKTRSMSSDDMKCGKIIIANMELVSPFNSFCKINGIKAEGMYRRIYGGDYFAYTKDNGHDELLLNYRHVYEKLHDIIYDDSEFQGFIEEAKECVDFFYLANFSIHSAIDHQYLLLPTLVSCDKEKSDIYEKIKTTGRDGMNDDWSDMVYIYRFKYGKEIRVLLEKGRDYLPQPVMIGIDEEDENEFYFLLHSKGKVLISKKIYQGLNMKKHRYDPVMSISSPASPDTHRPSCSE